jgi:non-canonical (house-cleaning) NTP pyrophosphatase
MQARSQSAAAEVPEKPVAQIETMAAAMKRARSARRC